MRIVRFKADGTVRYGELSGESIRAFKRSPFNLGGKKADGPDYRLADVKLLAPCRPSKLVCIGLNYRTHALELNQPLPLAPLLFLKPPSAVLDPGGAIVLPPNSRRVDYEAELGVVIGRKARNALQGDALKYVFGIFSVAKLVSFISGVMTLLPGDVIATGTPSGIGPMKAGDTVEVGVEEVGSLKNKVVAVEDSKE
ncbi:MAG: fumarylacetoacetate hydrolase family protein [Chloroflexota bacterium]